MCPMSETVLIADDDPDIVRFVRVNLNLEGFEVHGAANGEEAISVARTVRPDCVILDVMMPGMDGHAVLGRIRNGAHATLPVVMLTAAAGDEQAWQAWTEGVDYFIAKPFDGDELCRYLGYLFHTTSQTA
jgi:DNA-binding response OmpR family regulator